MYLFTSFCILALCYGFRKRFPVKEYGLLYVIGIGISVILYMIHTWEDHGNSIGVLPVLLSWVTTVVIIVNLFYVCWLYNINHTITVRFTVYFSVLSTLLGLPDEFNAGLSIALGIAGFVQMSLGMRLHQKVLRIISLFTLGIVLVKLVLVDLWAMPTVGKIVVFIMLGVILLVLSFLYQKLKDVLFKDYNEQIS